jgi:imidazolonepropionase-like amidohydrolase
MKPHLRAILQVGVLGALFGFSSLGAEVSAGDAAHVVLLENVRIFDPSVGAFTKPTDILIRGDRIEVTGDLEPPEGPVERRDAAGRYALAGLWDSHVHLAFLTLQSNTTMSASLRAFVAKGITGVRDVGGPLETISTLSRRIESGEFVGPRVYFAGPLLSQPPLYEQLQGLNRSLPGAAEL